MRRLTIFLIAVAAAAPAPAAVYHESGDAGALPFMAVDVLLTGPVEAIEGRIAHSFDADLFRIQIDDPATFSARAAVVPGMAPTVQLFVFDNFGQGVVAALASDNWLASPLPQIPSGTLHGRPAGTYLLGVSPAGNDPLAPSGASNERIFPDVDLGLSEPSGLIRYVPLFDWTRDYTAIGGNYAIELTGVSGVSQSPTLPGDYNQNGIVDAADYTVWRDKLGSGTLLPNDDTAGVGQDDYDRWKNNFGQSVDNGSGAGAAAAIPEPATSHSLLVVIGLVLTRRGCRLRASATSSYRRRVQRAIEGIAPLTRRGC